MDLHEFPEVVDLGNSVSESLSFITANSSNYKIVCVMQIFLSLDEWQ